MGKFLDALGKVAGSLVAAGVTAGKSAINNCTAAEGLKPEYRELCTERLVEILKAGHGTLDPKAVAAYSVLKERGWKPSQN
jgi:hypothetical protein